MVLHLNHYMLKNKKRVKRLLIHTSLVTIVINRLIVANLDLVRFKEWRGLTIFDSEKCSLAHFDAAEHGWL